MGFCGSGLGGTLVDMVVRCVGGRAGGRLDGLMGLVGWVAGCCFAFVIAVGVVVAVVLFNAAADAANAADAADAADAVVCALVLLQVCVCVRVRVPVHQQTNTT